MLVGTVVHINAFLERRLIKLVTPLLYTRTQHTRYYSVAIRILEQTLVNRSFNPLVFR
jgi:hypothetical protein